MGQHPPRTRHGYEQTEGAELGGIVGHPGRNVESRGQLQVRVDTTGQPDGCAR